MTRQECHATRRRTVEKAARVQARVEMQRGAASKECLPSLPWSVVTATRPRASSCSAAPSRVTQRVTIVTIATRHSASPSQLGFPAARGRSLSVTVVRHESSLCVTWRRVSPAAVGPRRRRRRSLSITAKCVTKHHRTSRVIACPQLLSDHGDGWCQVLRSDDGARGAVPTAYLRPVPTDYARRGHGRSPSAVLSSRPRPRFG